MNLRNATTTDLKAVISWIADGEDCRTWAGPVVRFPMTIRSLKADIGFEKDNAYCLDQVGCLLGFGQLIRKGEFRLHMARVIIDPQARNKGNGKYWVHVLMDLAWQKECRSISLNVYRQNTPAVKLYTAAGFRENAEKSTGELCHMIAEKRRSSRLK